MKEVIIDEVDINEAEKRIEQIGILCDRMQKKILVRNDNLTISTGRKVMISIYSVL